MDNNKIPKAGKRVGRDVPSQKMNADLASLRDDSSADSGDKENHEPAAGQHGWILKRLISRDELPAPAAKKTKITKMSGSRLAKAALADSSAGNSATEPDNMFALSNGIMLDVKKLAKTGQVTVLKNAQSLTNFAGENTASTGPPKKAINKSSASSTGGEKQQPPNLKKNVSMAGHSRASETDNTVGHSRAFGNDSAGHSRALALLPEDEQGTSTGIRCPPPSTPSNDVIVLQEQLMQLEEARKAILQKRVETAPPQPQFANIFPPFAPSGLTNADFLYLNWTGGMKLRRIVGVVRLSKTFTTRQSYNGHELRLSFDDGGDLLSVHAWAPYADQLARIPEGCIAELYELAVQEQQGPRETWKGSFSFTGLFNRNSTIGTMRQTPNGQCIAPMPIVDVSDVLAIEQCAANGGDIGDGIPLADFEIAEGLNAAAKGDFSATLLEEEEEEENGGEEEEVQFLGQKV